MLDLILTILLFNVLVVLFKLFPKYGVDSIQALTVNYIVAGCCAAYLQGFDFDVDHIVHSSWLVHALLIGVLFIVVFNLYVQATQKVGIAIATVANKMSLIFPVLIALLIYPDDKITGYKVIGLILAILGIVLTSLKGGKLNFPKKYLWLVLGTFIGQGIADGLFADCDRLPGAQKDKLLIFVLIFIAATTMGILMQLFNSKKSKFHAKNILWGILVGVPNFGTLFFLFRSFETSGLENSIIYPIMSMGVIVSSSIIGIVLFKEHLSRSNWIGIGCAMLGILAVMIDKL